MATWQRWKGIMKCYPFEEKRLAKWTPPFIVQPKYDGFRCRAMPTPSGDYLLLSSEENPIFSVPHINVALNESGFSDVELDGELYCHGMSFDAISSIVSRTVNLHPDYTKMQFHIFDVTTVELQIERTINLSQCNVEEPLIISPYWTAENLEEVMAIYSEIIGWGYEGIIVRHPYCMYERKRSTKVMKFKPKQEDNYAIVGYEEEISKDGDPKGTLGSLICKSGDGNIFTVGSGFSRQDRILYWRERDKLAGRVVRIQYQHITPGRKVPRFPVFVEVV